jgi:hypothetical protein
VLASRRWWRRGKWNFTTWANVRASQPDSSSTNPRSACSPSRARPTVALPAGRLTMRFDYKQQNSGQSPDVVVDHSATAQDQELSARAQLVPSTLGNGSMRAHREAKSVRQQPLECVSAYMDSVST